MFASYVLHKTICIFLLCYWSVMIIPLLSGFTAPLPYASDSCECVSHPKAASCILLARPALANARLTLSS